MYKICNHPKCIVSKLPCKKEAQFPDGKCWRHSEYSMWAKNPKQLPEEWNIEEKKEVLV